MVSDTVYNTTIVRKSLLHWVDKDRHVKMTVDFLKVGKRFRQVYSGLLFSQPCTEVFHDTLQYCDGVYDKSNTLIAILAGVQAVEALKGESQKTEAKRLIDKYGASGVLPNALHATLEAIDAGGASKQTRM